MSKTRHPIYPTCSVGLHTPLAWGYTHHPIYPTCSVGRHRPSTPHAVRGPKHITMSYTTSYYHIVIRTYRSEPTINEEHERELYAYIYGIAKNLKCQTYRIGGIADHIHMFVSLPSYLSLASFVQRVKTDSSKWLKANPHFPDFRGWGREYAGFSYSLRDKDMIVGYIKKQKEHHRKKTFAEEHRAFLTENGVSIDERYFLRDD